MKLKNDEIIKKIIKHFEFKLGVRQIEQECYNDVCCCGDSIDIMGTTTHQ